MPCYSPITAYYSREVGVSGKRGIVFASSKAHSGSPLRLPCGQCVGCRLERSRQWAARCVHENRMHSASAFVTLTYDEKSLPSGGTLVKADLSAFCKRLHNRLLRSRGKGVRYYGCGEYGENTGRPHYHVIIFGYDFPDKKVYAPGRDGRVTLFTSREVSQLWPMGMNVIGEVTFDSCAYVARYVMKKITGESADEHYTTADGEVLQPEFTVMSRRPGIGYDWYRKYGEHAYQLDSVVLNGKEVRPPRYYDTKYEEVDAERLDVLKKERRRRAILLARPDSTSVRRRVCEVVALAKLKQKGRVL